MMIDWLWWGMVALLVYGTHYEPKHMHTYWDYPPYTPRKGPKRPQERR